MNIEPTNKHTPLLEESPFAVRGISFCGVPYSWTHPCSMLDQSLSLFLALCSEGHGPALHMRSRRHRPPFCADAAQAAASTRVMALSGGNANTWNTSPIGLLGCPRLDIKHFWTAHRSWVQVLCLFGPRLRQNIDQINHAQKKTHKSEGKEHTTKHSFGDPTRPCYYSFHLQLLCRNTRAEMPATRHRHLCPLS